MFCQQAKPRAGVAEILSDGEELSVTNKNVLVKKHRFFIHLCRAERCFASRQNREPGSRKF